MDDGDAEQSYTGKNVAVDDEVPVFRWLLIRLNGLLMVI